jgi:acetyltransferase-like isoleucine patch superfamily enzyme
VSIGAGSAIEDDVIIQISNGGRIVIGDGVRVRTSAVLNVSGMLELRGDNLVSWNCVIHCGDSVVFEEMAGTGEGVTVVDGTHFHGAIGAADEHWYHNNRHAPVVIGRNTWLAAKCTIGAGVTLGARTTVAAHSFVREGVYEDGIVLAGSPARRVDS